MILELLVGLIFAVFKVVFSFINLPGFPDELQNSVNNYLDLIFANLDFLSFFVRPATLKYVAIATISLLVFKQSYKVIMWIWSKIPGLGK